MSIIVSDNGKNARKIDRSAIAQEEYLQNYIHDNPASLPLYEISEDLRLLILAREFQTTSGPIDAVGIDQNGSLYVIETKLYKNPDKRLVLAQILDYGAALWSAFDSGKDFLERLASATTATFGISLDQKIHEFFGLETDSVQAVIAQITSSQENGQFRFVVLMDRLEDRLKDLITFVNQNSTFDIYDVELEFYKFEQYEILIPRLFGAEVKKDLGSGARSTSRRTGLAAKDYIRQKLTETGTFRIEEGEAAGYGEVNIKTALSDLKNPKYCGKGLAPLNITKRADGTYILI